MTKARPATAVFGAGRLAKTLLPSLIASGYPVVAVMARRRSQALAAARLTPQARPTTSLRNAARPAQLWLLAVPDPALASVASQLSELDQPEQFWSQVTVFHHAGGVDLTPLLPLRDRGASIGLIHPLQTCSGTAAAVAALPGSYARVAADAAALPTARRLIADLKLIALELGDALTVNEQAAYHAAAALCSNDVLALLSLGVEQLVRLGLERSEAQHALVQLARGTLDQAAEQGLDRSLTGPAVRGDLTTLRRHMERLAASSPHAAAAHHALSCQLLRLAPMDPSTRRRLQRRLARLKPR